MLEIGLAHDLGVIATVRQSLGDDRGFIEKLDLVVEHLNFVCCDDDLFDAVCEARVGSLVGVLVVVPVGVREPIRGGFVIERIAAVGDHLAEGHVAGSRRPVRRFR